jgi:chemotaxis protein CheZ
VPSNPVPLPRADRAEITEVVQSIVTSLSGDLSPGDVSLYKELEALAKFIHEAKGELAALRPQDIRDKHLPTATDELDAIVSATAEATHTILDAVESIERISTSMPEGAALGDHVIAIYQACSFQDITGQRINKVVKTLKQIESKVDQLLSAFGDEVAQQRTKATNEAAEAEQAAKAAREEHLLNGPQLPTEAVSQADIDALFMKS